MSERPEHHEPDELSISEKILRVQDLWDDIARQSGDVVLTAAQREEIERRLQAHESSPGRYTTWEELRARLEREL
jgi:putative addiction module component (TIGR02574 family)